MLCAAGYSREQGQCGPCLQGPHCLVGAQAKEKLNTDREVLGPKKAPDTWCLREGFLGEGQAEPGGEIMSGYQTERPVRAMAQRLALGTTWT